MSFYDIDLEEQVQGKYELWVIEQTIQFSSLLYLLKDI